MSVLRNCRAIGKVAFITAPCAARCAASQRFQRRKVPANTKTREFGHLYASVFRYVDWL